MNLIGGILIIIVGIIIGIFIGKLGQKFSTYLQNKKIKKMAKEVLSGERKNQFDLDGKTIDVYKFRLNDENGKEVIIDLREINKKVEILPEENKNDEFEQFKQFQEFLNKNKKGKKNGRRRV